MKDKWSILYVDDDYDSCQLIPIWLANGGPFSVTSIEDANEASLIIEHTRFDLYLLDYCIPDITGVSLCRQIRNRDSIAPIVLYSALDRDIDKESAYAAGADLFLIKPDDLGQLIPRIELLLEESKFRSKRSDLMRTQRIRPSRII